MSSWNQKANSIFLHAVEEPAGDRRRAYLDQACAGDGRLRQEVESLLDADNAGLSIFDRAAPLLTVEYASPETVGAQIGPYKLREQIGEGGMGVVYVAEQTEPVKRKVALKIIRPGMASRDVVARFEAERQALAMMDHPNIARVFDGGATNTGQPYFVMELVQGPPITDYCDQHKLTNRDRLELFEKVCRAVQHAHQKGVIHRDLKPTNVLVPRIDGKPVPKVIDFGVAKATGQKLTEQTVYTQLSQLVGTPLYMSPEQAELGVVDIDTRSDVYSLGVLLYELLTGSTPFDSETLKQAGFDEMRRIIREDEPSRPSERVSTLAINAQSTIAASRNSEPRQLGASLRGELDWLVMKALEKDRNRRYESASALADDVDRFLTGKAVEACPPSVLYRLRKYGARNKPLIISSSLAAVVFTIVIVAIFQLITSRAAAHSALVASIETSLLQAREAMAADEMRLAQVAVAQAKKDALQFKGERDRPLEMKIQAIDNELLRYEHFSTTYHTARLQRTADSSAAYAALEVYGVLDDGDWQTQLEDIGVPQQYLERLREQVYELLVLLAHSKVLWPENNRTRVDRLESVEEAQRYLRLASPLRRPTKGYLWVLSTTWQRKGGLASGDKRADHDSKAQRLRNQAIGAAPQNAADLFYICRDRMWGAASKHTRQPFRNPISNDAELLEAFHEMLRIEPGYYNALFFSGLQYMEMELEEAAISAFQGCLAVEPGDYVAAYNLAGALTVAEWHQESVLAMHKANASKRAESEADPRYTQADAWLAEGLALEALCLARAGQQEAARKCLAEARTLHGNIDPQVIDKSVGTGKIELFGEIIETAAEQGELPKLDREPKKQDGMQHSTPPPGKSSDSHLEASDAYTPDSNGLDVHMVPAEKASR